jgi:hypothetical protein
MVFLAFLTLGYPLLLVVLGEQLGLRSWVLAHDWIFGLSPMFLYAKVFNSSFSGWHMAYWIYLAASHGFAWLFVAAACLRTARVWRGLPESRLAALWGRHFRRRARRSRTRGGRRGTLLERNPVAWLESQNPLPGRVLGFLVLLNAGLCVAAHLKWPRQWPDADFVMTWALITQYILCQWIAIQAPQRLADDKQSGALELLLATAVKPREIVRGLMRGQWRRFGWSFAGLLATDLFLVYCCYSWPGGNRPMVNFFGWMILGGFLVFAVQAYCTARVGLFLGLVYGSSVRATYGAFWRCGLLPWAVILVFWVEFGTAIFSRISPAAKVPVSVSASALLHLLVCALFLARANWQLRRHFRYLAASTGRQAWWRWGREQRTELEFRSSK